MNAELKTAPLSSERSDTFHQKSPALSAMSRWASDKYGALWQEREPRNCNGVFVYAAMLDGSALVSRTSEHRGLEIVLKDVWEERVLGKSGIVFWPDFYASARRHRTVLGVFDASGKLLLDYRIAPRGWQSSAPEAADQLKTALQKVGIPKEHL